MVKSLRCLITVIGVMFATPGMSQVLMQGAGVSVTAEEIRLELQRMPADARKNLLNPQTLANNVSNIYARRVLAQRAQSTGVDKNPVVQQAILRATERILSDAMLEKIDQDNQPSLQAIENYAVASYKANPKRFEQPEMVRARHILIRTAEPDARQKIEDIAKQLKQGADFESLAKARSQDPGSASKGGDLGYFDRGRMVKPFEDAAFSIMEKGGVSEIFESPFGFHILQLIDRKPVSTQPFTEVKDTLMREAQNEILNKARLNARDQIVQQAKMDEAAVAALVQNMMSLESSSSQSGAGVSETGPSVSTR